MPSGPGVTLVFVQPKVVLNKTTELNKTRAGREVAAIRMGATIAHQILDSTQVCAGISSSEMS
jgi:hypothetical protein